MFSFELLDNCEYLTVPVAGDNFCIQVSVSYLRGKIDLESWASEWVRVSHLKFGISIEHSLGAFVMFREQGSNPKFSLHNKQLD